MLDYYNLVPIFGKGKPIKFAIDRVTRLGRDIINDKGIKGLQDIAKEVKGFSPRLADMLEKAASSLESGKELDGNRIKKLIEESQRYRRLTDHNRRNRINESLRQKNKPIEQPKTEQPKTELKEKPNKPGVTLYSTITKSKKWLNEHPKIVIPAGIAAFSSSGREYIGKLFDWYLHGSPTDSTVKQDSVKQSPVSQQNVNQQVVKKPVDTVDSILNNIKKENLDVPQQSQRYEDVNDIFDESQW